MKARHPYEALQARAHWKSVSRANHPLDISGWYEKKFPISDLRIATAGSCFAQHIGRELRGSGFRYVDVEPAPNLLDPSRHAAYGYGLYSARYGNIYTVRQLLQLLQRATGEFQPQETVWPHGEAFVDPFRPTIEPRPMPRDEVEELNLHHLARVRKLFESIDVFVFTLGLTEAWIDARDGAVYPVAPGVSGGTYDPKIHKLVNFGVHQVQADLELFIAQARAINPQMRFLLTVSPVPLMATATANHVAVASMYSKSVLRAVAGVIADNFAYVDYFPSYEIIASHVMRGQFYNSDMRAINRTGVDHVMKQFFAEHAPPDIEKGKDGPMPLNPDDVSCDEELLASFGE